MNKVALVTGSVGNLGKAVTEKLSDAGFTVIGIVEPGKNDLPAKKTTVYRSLDLTDYNATKSLIQEIKSSYGKIDAIVCLVGGFEMGNILETTNDDLQRMIELNFNTAFNIVRPTLSIMKEQSEIGRIILVGAKPVYDQSAAGAVFSYALSKSMVVKLAEIINANASDYNAVATVIVPSIIDTPANREAMPDADFSDWVTTASIAEQIALVCGEKGKDLRETVLKIYGNS